MKDTRKTTLEEHIQIAKECIESERSYGLIAAKHGVSYQQVHPRVLKYKELGKASLKRCRGQLKCGQEPRTEPEKAQIGWSGLLLPPPLKFPFRTVLHSHP